MSACCKNACGCLETGNSTLELHKLKPGDSARVTGYASGNPAYLDKLLAMGLVRGTTIHVVRVAPLGDPIDLRVRNFHLTLRKDEAAVLKLENA